ncbi:unnamed protein product [Amaranthus hypochondriacus]
MNFHTPDSKDHNVMNAHIIPVQENKNAEIFHIAVEEDVNALNSYVRVQEDYDVMKFVMQAQKDNILFDLSDLYSNNELASFDNPQAMNHDLPSIQHKCDTVIKSSSPSYKDINAFFKVFSFDGCEP